MPDPNNQIPVVAIGAPLDDGLISIKVSTAAGNMTKSATITMANDTASVEKNMKTSLQASVVQSGLVISTWQWTFSIDNYKTTGALVDYWFALDPGSKTMVTLIGIEPSGAAHITTKWIKSVYSLDGLPGIITVSKTALAGGMYSYVIAAHKKGMAGIKGNYGYTGSVTSPTWTVTPIAVVDTNYNYINGALVPAPAGDVGKYVAARIILYPAAYRIVFGRIDKTGSLIFAKPWGWFPDGNFNVSQNGDLTGVAVVNLPGVSGDEGIGAVVRKDILASSVVVYTKHASVFTKGFAQLQNADGTWQAPLAETAVSGFPNWGKVEILYSAFPISQVLTFRFGSNIDSPGILDAMYTSGYWDNMLQVLTMKIVVVTGT